MRKVPRGFAGVLGTLLERWVPFLIHEFAHERVKGHLSDEYHRECCRLAGILARVIAEDRSILDTLAGNSGAAGPESSPDRADDARLSH
jgi:hypothetical protein